MQKLFKISKRLKVNIGKCLSLMCSSSGELCTSGSISGFYHSSEYHCILVGIWSIHCRGSQFATNPVSSAVLCFACITFPKLAGFSRIFLPLSSVSAQSCLVWRGFSPSTERPCSVWDVTVKAETHLVSGVQTANRGQIRHRSNAFGHMFHFSYVLYGFPSMG